jgi:GTP-binding protein YchF
MSSLSCGIVGLPNVGKSSLANVLAKMQVAESANYPFCTIEPNHFTVSIKDDRLQKLAAIAGSQKIIESQIDLWDIAGLVKDASKGEGLGNKFLANIREVDAIVQVIRCFENNDITHVYNNVDPLRDKEIIEYELILADLDSIENRLPKLLKKKDPESQKEADLLKKIEIMLRNDKMPYQHLHELEVDKKEIKKLQLLTTKPILYLLNISEDDSKDDKYIQNPHCKAVIEKVGQGNYIAFPIKLETDCLGLDETERDEMLESLELPKDNINKLLKKCFDILNLKSFFTVGPKEAHSWTIENGFTAPQAAGVIHSDFEKGFIRAETISYDDYIKYNGEQGAKNNGKSRTEGKEYVVQDGDVMHFLFNN